MEDNLPEMPDWLPPVIVLDGLWDEWIERLYQVFDNDFKNPFCFHVGTKLQIDNRIIPGERFEEGFWHIVTTDNRYNGGRDIDPRRAERLPWCAPTITHPDAPEVLFWDYREGSQKIRTYLWLSQHDYVVILERRRKVFYLVTAFYLDGRNRREAMEKKRQKGLKKQEPLQGKPSDSRSPFTHGE